MLSDAEKQYLAASIQHGIRLDGRSCSDIRPVELELSLIAQASGSARLHIGATDVLVGVKVEVGAPEREHPTQGRLQVSVECSPCASPEYEGRGGEDWGAQLASALEASLLPGPSGKGGGLDLGKLCIVSGKHCWIVYVDGLVLNDGGNVLGALSMAARAALANTRIPRVEVGQAEEGEEPELELDDDPESCVLLDVSKVPVIITVAQVGQQCVLDLSADEETCAAASLHVAVGQQGKVCGITQDGSMGINLSMLQAMLESARRAGTQMAQALDQYMLRARPPA